MEGGGSLRVALVGQYPGEDGRMTSGVASVLSALADGLATHGVDVHVVTCVTGLDRTSARVAPNGVTVHSVPSPGKLAWMIGFPVEVAGIRSVLGSICPDMVHCHTQTVYADAALERGWPSLLTIHGIYALEVMHMRGWRRFQGKLLLRFERAALSRARHIVCISEYLRRKMRSALECRDVRLIENPIDDRYFETSDETEPGRVLYSGTIVRRKNLMGLLDAVARLVSRGVDVNLSVAGSQAVEPGYSARCVEYVSERRLDEHVSFLGTLPIDALIGELGRANMLVLPSYQETAPMVISEAMAAGKPVVTTPAGGSADMVEDGKTGSVVPFDDSEALAGAIERLLGDANLRTNMGRRAREEAERRFRCSVVAEKTLAFYADILRCSAE